jgi:hypothetical protein
VHYLFQKQKKRFGNAFFGHFWRSAGSRSSWWSLLRWSSMLPTAERRPNQLLALTQGNSIYKLRNIGQTLKKDQQTHFCKFLQKFWSKTWENKSSITTIIWSLLSISPAHLWRPTSRLLNIFFNNSFLIIIIKFWILFFL